MIYVAGDSHIHVFENNPMFTVRGLSAVTVYNLKKEDSKTKSHELLMKVVTEMNKEKDTLILVAGEIDCRNHIYYQSRKQQVPVSELVDRTIQNYGEVMKQLEDMGVKFIICSTTPAGYEIEPYLTQTGNTLYIKQFLEQFQYMPTFQEYAELYKEFNQKLKEFCLSKRYKYLDLYSRFVGPDGHTLREFLWDLQHLDIIKAQPIVINMLKGLGVES